MTPQATNLGGPTNTADKLAELADKRIAIAAPNVVRSAPQHVRRQAADLDEWLNRRRKPVPTSLSDYAAGAAVGFALGLMPFVGMLAYLEFAS